MPLAHLTSTFTRAITELDAALARGRPVSALMRRMWIDGDFAGDCVTLLRLFRDSEDAEERKAAVYYLDLFEEEQRKMKRGLKQFPAERMCRA